jgi:hypothetical protein
MTARLISTQGLMKSEFHEFERIQINLQNKAPSVSESGDISIR